MKKSLLLIASAIFTLNGALTAQEANFSGVTDGQEICTGDGIISLTADNNTTGVFSGAGVTDNGNGTASFDPAIAGPGNHGISYQINGAEFIKISSFGHHTLGIKSDGTLWAWGFGSFGQMGNGTTADNSTPKQVGSENNWVEVAAGFWHSLGIKSDGTLWAWGRNSAGQLGDGTTTDRLTPVKIGTATDWVKIAAGHSHSLCLKSNGTLWKLEVTVTQIGTASNWSQITGGKDYSFGIRSDGSLWAWGINNFGQLGDGTTTNRSSPVQIASGSSWIKLAASVYYSMGIKSDGTLWVWGYDDISGDPITTPIQIGTDNDWSQIAVGETHKMGIKSDGTLWVYGNNFYGQLGDPNSPSTVNFNKLGTDNNWSIIGAGRLHSLSIKSDGTLWAWGDNSTNQLGDGTTTQRNTPVLISSPSVIALTKTISVVASPSNIVSQSGNTLTASETGASYQWLDCNNSNTSISGATSQSFTPTIGGNYAVRVTKNGCSIISTCITISGLSATDLDKNTIRIYPNPSNAVFTVILDQLGSSYSLSDINGKILIDGTIKEHSTEFNLQNVAEGLYFLRVGNNVTKLIKQ